MFRLVDEGWSEVLDEALCIQPDDVCLVSPFIKETAARRLLKRGHPKRLRVLTRFALQDMYDGVNDVAALRLLLRAGASIRGVRNLHAKLYVFGDRLAVLTSANLTEAALTRNHEFGVVSDDAEMIASCRDYFESLWAPAGNDLDEGRLSEWEDVLGAEYRVSGPRPRRGSLRDLGVDLGFAIPATELPPHAREVRQAFVKFFGIGSDRLPLDSTIGDVVRRTGGHWACAYPRAKRPRQVKDGAIMFLSHLTEDPNDIVIFGRAIALAHVPKRDVATAADIERRPWKQKWPNYVRVHHPEFVEGLLRNGVSLNELMDELGSEAFASTQFNRQAGSGNTDPRHAYRQQAAVELAPEGLAWLHQRLEQAIATYGLLDLERVEGLDWPNEGAPVE